MHGRRPFGEEGHQDMEPFGEEALLSGPAGVGIEQRSLGEVPSRPARQRVELRNEEAWLKRQLADWDDFDFKDLEEL